MPFSQNILDNYPTYAGTIYIPIHNAALRVLYFNSIITIVVSLKVLVPGPAFDPSETKQGALEQAIGRIPGLRIEGP